MTKQCTVPEIWTDGRMDGWKKSNIKVGASPKNLKKLTLSIVNAGPPDTEYLCYPHVEGVTLEGSLFPANIR